MSRRSSASKATRASGVSRERKQSRQASRQQTASPRVGKQRRRRRATAAVTRDPGTSDRPEDRECSRSCSDSVAPPHSSGRTGERCTSRRKERCCASRASVKRRRWRSVPDVGSRSASVVSDAANGDPVSRAHVDPSSRVSDSCHQGVHDDVRILASDQRPGT